MGVIGLQALCQCLGLVAADRRGTQWVPADIRPAQRVMIEKNDPPDAGLREGTGHWRANGPASDQDGSRCEEPGGPGISAATMYPSRIGSLNGTSNDRIGAEEPVDQHRLRRAARSEAFGQRLQCRAGMRLEPLRV